MIRSYSDCPPPITILQDELLGNILKYLSARDLSRSERVSQTWKVISENSPMWQKLLKWTQKFGLILIVKADSTCKKTFFTALRKLCPEALLAFSDFHKDNRWYPNWNRSLKALKCISAKTSPALQAEKDYREAILYGYRMKSYEEYDFGYKKKQTHALKRIASNQEAPEKYRMFAKARLPQDEKADVEKEDIIHLIDLPDDSLKWQTLLQELASLNPELQTKEDFFLALLKQMPEAFYVEGCFYQNQGEGDLALKSFYLSKDFIDKWQIDKGFHEKMLLNNALSLEEKAKALHKHIPIWYCTHDLSKHFNILQQIIDHQGIPSQYKAVANSIKAKLRYHFVTDEITDQEAFDLLQHLRTGNDIPLEDKTIAFLFQLRMILDKRIGTTSTTQHLFELNQVLTNPQISNKTKLLATRLINEFEQNEDPLELFRNRDPSFLNNISPLIGPVENPISYAKVLASPYANGEIKKRALLILARQEPFDLDVDITQAQGLIEQLLKNPSISEEDRITALLTKARLFYQHGTHLEEAFEILTDIINSQASVEEKGVAALFQAKMGYSYQTKHLNCETSYQLLNEIYYNPLASEVLKKAALFEIAKMRYFGKTDKISDQEAELIFSLPYNHFIKEPPEKYLNRMRYESQRSPEGTDFRKDKLLRALRKSNFSGNLYFTFNELDAASENFLDLRKDPQDPEVYNKEKWYEIEAALCKGKIGVEYQTNQMSDEMIFLLLKQVIKHPLSTEEQKNKATLLMARMRYDGRTSEINDDETCQMLKSLQSDSLNTSAALYHLMMSAEGRGETMDDQTIVKSFIEISQNPSTLPQDCCLALTYLAIIDYLKGTNTYTRKATHIYSTNRVRTLDSVLTGAMRLAGRTNEISYSKALSLISNWFLEMPVNDSLFQLIITQKQIGNAKPESPEDILRLAILSFKNNIFCKTDEEIFALFQQVCFLNESSDLEKTAARFYQALMPKSPSTHQMTDSEIEDRCLAIIDTIKNFATFGDDNKSFEEELKLRPLILAYEMLKSGRAKTLCKLQVFEWIYPLNHHYPHEDDNYVNNLTLIIHYIKAELVYQNPTLQKVIYPQPNKLPYTSPYRWKSKLLLGKILYEKDHKIAEALKLFNEVENCLYAEEQDQEEARQYKEKISAS